MHIRACVQALGSHGRGLGRGREAGVPRCHGDVGCARQSLLEPLPTLDVPVPTPGAGSWQCPCCLPAPCAAGSPSSSWGILCSQGTVPACQPLGSEEAALTSSCPAATSLVGTGRPSGVLALAMELGFHGPRGPLASGRGQSTDAAPAQWPCWAALPASTHPTCPFSGRSVARPPLLTGSRSSP